MPDQARDADDAISTGSDSTWISKQEKKVAYVEFLVLTIRWMG